jgi:hypothetical protein
MLISRTMPSITVWMAGPPMAVRSAVVVLQARMSAVFQGVNQELMAVRAEPVTGPDHGDAVEVLVVDVVDAR